MDLVNKYDLPISDFLKYMSLKACIPNEWKHKLTTEASTLQTYNSLIKQVVRKKHKNQFL